MVKKRPMAKDVDADEYVALSSPDSDGGVTFTSYLASDFAWKDYWANARLSETEPGNTSVCRSVCSVDSLVNLPTTECTQGFDVVAIDECQFSMFQLLSSLRSDEEQDANIRTLAELLRSARRVILLQHRISDTCVDAYTSLAGATISDVLRRKVVTPQPLIPMRYSTSRRGLWEYVRLCVSFYLTHWLPDGSSKPFMVFTNQKGLACMIKSLLLAACDKACSIAGHTDVSTARKRVLLIMADNASLPECREFCDNPDAVASQYDVVIVTPVLQAGLSITTHFVTAFDFLFNGIMTYRDTMQLAGRLRVSGDRQLEPFRHSWIQKGRTGSRDKAIVRFMDDVKHTRGIHNEREDISQLDIRAKRAAIRLEMAAELADHYNRGSFLWVRDYRKAGVAHQHYTPRDDDFHPDISLKWIRNEASKSDEATIGQLRYSLMFERSYAGDENVGVSDASLHKVVQHGISAHIGYLSSYMVSEYLATAGLSRAFAAHVRNFVDRDLPDVRTDELLRIMSNLLVFNDKPCLARDLTSWNVNSLHLVWGRALSFAHGAYFFYAVEMMRVYPQIWKEMAEDFSDRKRWRFGFRYLGDAPEAVALVYLLTRRGALTPEQGTYTPSRETGWFVDGQPGLSGPGAKSTYHNPCDLLNDLDSEEAHTLRLLGLVDNNVFSMQQRHMICTKASEWTAPVTPAAFATPMKTAHPPRVGEFIKAIFAKLGFSITYRLNFLVFPRELTLVWVLFTFVFASVDGRSSDGSPEPVCELRVVENIFHLDNLFVEDLIRFYRTASMLDAHEMDNRFPSLGDVDVCEFVDPRTGTNKAPMHVPQLAVRAAFMRDRFTSTADCALFHESVWVEICDQMERDFSVFV